jgi:DNA-binding beta-propeller fold protein YncE
MRRTIQRRTLFPILLTLCFGACVGVSAAATNHPFQGTITGEKIGPFEMFKDACGVAVDSHGDLYVADYYQNRVVVFNSKEEFLTAITDIVPLDSGGVAPIDGPCDLAVDTAGNLYVNDYHRDVVRFTPAVYPPAKGTAYGPKETIDTSHPTGVAVDSTSGDVYIDERTSVAVFKAPILPADAPALRIGAGDLQDGYGVAVSGFTGTAEYPATAGYVYVADAASDSVKVYDPAGDLINPIEAIGGEGTPPAGFTSLVDTDLAIDSADGHLYLADNLQPHFESPEAIVYEFSSKGHYRSQIPSPKAEGESSFLRHGEPSGIAVIPSGRIYVTSGNYENAGVFVFGPAPFAFTQLLSVTKSGTGTVASSPPGLRCGGACVGEFERGSRITLFATPDRGSRLAGWSGCEEELAANSCTMTMSADRAVDAEFEPAPQLTLTVIPAGTGVGTISSLPTGIECGGACEDEFDEGSDVTLTASAAAGSHLAGWSGCNLEPTPSSCKVTMNVAHSVAAEFKPTPAESGDPGPAAPRARAPIPLVPSAPSPTVGAALRVGRLTVKGVVARLRVAIPGPGVLSASGKGLHPTSEVSLRTGEATLTLKLSSAGKQALARAKGDRLAVKVEVAFAPVDEGAALGAAKTVAFKAAGGKR